MCQYFIIIVKILVGINIIVFMELQELSNRNGRKF